MESLVYENSTPLAWSCTGGGNCGSRNSTNVGRGRVFGISDSGSSPTSTLNMTYDITGLNQSNLKIRFLAINSLGTEGTRTATLYKDGVSDQTYNITGSGINQGYFNLSSYNRSTKYHIEFLIGDIVGVSRDIEFDSVHIANENNVTYIGQYATDYIANPVAGSYEYLINGTGNSTGVTFWAMVRQTAPIEIVIFQDNNATEQKFEYGRRNISIRVETNFSTAFCISFDALGFENSTCYPASTSRALNYTVDKFRAVNFSDGRRIRNLTIGTVSERNLTLNLTRYKNVTDAYLNLTEIPSRVNVSDGSRMASVNNSYRNTGFPRLDTDLDWNGSHLLVPSWRETTAVNFIDIYNSEGTYLTNCTYYTEASSFAGGVASNGSHIVVNGFDGSDFRFMVLTPACVSLANTTPIVTNDANIHGAMDWNGSHWIILSMASANRSISVWNTGLDAGDLDEYLFTVPARYVATATGLVTIRDDFIALPISNQYGVAYFDLEGNNIFNDTFTNEQMYIFDLDWLGLEFNSSHMFFSSDTNSIFETYCSICAMRTTPLILRDLSIDINNDRSRDIIIPGEMNGTNFQNRAFTNNLRSEILSFQTGGSITRYFNLSTIFMNFSNPNVTDHSYNNITLQLYGSDANTVGGNFTENFTSDRYINRTEINSSYAGRYGLVVYDDFSQRTPQNITTRWVRYNVLTPPDTEWTFSTAPNSTVLTSNHRGGTGVVGQALRTNDWDFKNNYEIVINLSAALIPPPNTGADGTVRIGLRNNNTAADIDLVVYTFTAGGLQNINETVKLNRTGDRVTGYKNQTAQSSTVLDLSANYSLFFQQEVVRSIPIGTTRFVLNVHNISMSGTGGNYSINHTYRNATIRSTQVINSSGADFSVARLDADYVAPAGTSVTWYLSANNASTWEEATVGKLHLFTNGGKGISWRADIGVNESGNVSNFFPLSPIIKRVMISGPVGNATNVTIDVGADGFAEWRGVDESLTQVNSSVSPRNITLSNVSIASFVFYNCAGKKTCLVPVKFSSDSAGLLNYTNITFLTSSRNINLLRGNSTMIDQALRNSSQLNLSFHTSTGGIIEITNFTALYPHDFNYTVRVNLNDTANFSVSSNSSSLMTRYSRFISRINAPFIHFVLNRTSTAVQPFNQSVNLSIYNLTGNASLDPFNLTIRWLEAPPTCFNLTVSRTNNTNGSLFNLTTGEQVLNSSLPRNTTIGYWFFAYSSACTGRFTLPNISYATYCQDCVYR